MDNLSVVRGLSIALIINRKISQIYTSLALLTGSSGSLSHVRIEIKVKPFNLIKGVLYVLF